jgi:hypothetical protein
MASEPSTGQAQVLPASFTYRKSGGSGGACASSVPYAPRRARDALESGVWFLAALAGALLALRPRASTRPAT